jgi:hypothetical protein
MTRSSGMEWMCMEMTYVESKASLSAPPLSRDLWPAE